MAEEKKKQDEGSRSADDKLIAAACEAYGIPAKYVFAGRIDARTGEAVILTQGGSKVRFKAGDKPAPLSQIAVTGVNPEWAKKKVIAGKEKK